MTEYRRRRRRRGLAVVAVITCGRTSLGENRDIAIARARSKTPWIFRGGETESEDVEDVLDNLLLEESENANNVDNLFLDEFREELQNLRMDIEADALGSFYRLKREILVQRVRNAQKRKLVQQKLRRQRKLEAQRSLREGQSELRPGDTQLEGETQAALQNSEIGNTGSISFDEPSEPQSPVMTNNKTSLYVEVTESTAKETKGSDSSMPSVDITTDAPTNETNQVEIEADFGDMGILMDATAEIGDTLSEEDQQREKIDVFDDFVVGETDEEDNSVLERLQVEHEPSTLQEVVQDDYVQSEQSELVPLGGAFQESSNINTGDSDTEQESKVGESTEASGGAAVKVKRKGATKRKKRSTTGRKKASGRDLAGPNVKTPHRERKKSKVKIRKKSDGSNSINEPESSIKQTAIEPSGKQDSDLILFAKTMGLGIVMLGMCFVISVIYDYIIAKVAGSI